MAKDPKRVADKWSKKLSGAIEDIREGVQAVTEAPSRKAIAKKDKLKRRWNESIDSGKWENNLGKVGLEDWKEAFINFGLDRIASGAEKGKGKMEDFMNQLLPYQESIKKTIERMPDLTLEQRIARSAEWQRLMAKFRKK